MFFFRISLSIKNLYKYVLRAVSIIMAFKILTSNDGTKRIDFDDGYSSVIIPTVNGKYAVCVSCQIGCPLGCRFCYSGKAKLKRNLTCSEIVNQAKAAKEIMNKNPYSVVFMGMGEPMLNFENVINAAEKIHSEFQVRCRRITISTSGIMLEKLLNIQYNVAISLHSPFDKIRKKLMPNNYKINFNMKNNKITNKLIRAKLLPNNKSSAAPMPNNIKKLTNNAGILNCKINNNHKINEILNFARKYAKKHPKHELMIEYALIKGITDSDKDMKKLFSLKWPKKTNFNFIEFNDIGKFKKSGRERLFEFKNYAIKRGYKSFVRYSRGADIKAACGMLGIKQSF